MSTKKMREALRLVDAEAFPHQGDREQVRTLLRDALAEVEEIEAVAKDMMRSRDFNVGRANALLNRIAEEAP